jgi:hypothetical protein
MAEAVPPGGAVLLPRDWLVEALEGAGSPVAQPLAVDFTVTDLVALFGKRPSTVRSWLEAGLFPGAFKLRGKTWRVPRSAVEAFQARERGQGGNDPPPLPRRASASLSDYRKVRKPA